MSRKCARRKRSRSLPSLVLYKDHISTECSEKHNTGNHLRNTLVFPSFKEIHWLGCMERRCLSRVCCSWRTMFMYKAEVKFMCLWNQSLVILCSAPIARVSTNIQIAWQRSIMAFQYIIVLMIYPGTWPIYRSNETIYLCFSQTKRTVGSRTGGMSWIIIALAVCLQSENWAITFLLPAPFFNPIAVQRGHLFKSRMLLALLSQHIEQTQLRFLPFA